MAIFGGFCLFLSTIEYLIPKPLPFIRVGIANIPLMIAIDMFPFGAFMRLLAIKVLGQALITGSLFSYVFLFSAGGSLASALGMYALRNLAGSKNISFIGIGITGALISNSVQILLARLFIFGTSAKFIAPPLLLLGLVTGLMLGIFCQHFAEQSRWYAEQFQDRPYDIPR